MQTRLTLHRPDDWHIHLRDGDTLAGTVSAVSRYFGRAIVMPNLVPPVTDLAALNAYRSRILAHRASGNTWQPLMTLYLTDHTTPAMIQEAYQSNQLAAVKLYPAGATTNSSSGVTNIANIYPVLETLAEYNIPLLVHGEVVDSDIDIFDREKVFIDRVLQPLVARYPQLKIVMEHITTGDAVAFVRESGEQIGATITPQHLLYHRNHLLEGGIKPHLYCLPILKHQRHRQALRDIIASGHPRFFAGTDSAPHAQNKKESACGCAGCYSGYGALELYAEIFDHLGILPKLENFVSHFGADFYSLPRHSDTISLIKKPWQVPESLSLGSVSVIPLKAGETLQWQIEA